MTRAASCRSSTDNLHFQSDQAFANIWNKAPLHYSYLLLLGQLSCVSVFQRSSRIADNSVSLAEFDLADLQAQRARMLVLIHGLIKDLQSAGVRLVHSSHHDAVALTVTPFAD